MRAAICAALFLCIAALPSRAADVTLTSRDGAVRIDGDLLGYDGEFYRVDTEYGVLTVDGSEVICEGPGCPGLEAYVAEVAISGARGIGAVLLPALVEAFAVDQGYVAEREVADDTRFAYHLSDRATGNPAARFTFHVTTTGEGFADLLAGEADLVMAVREATPGEERRARQAGLGNLGEARRSLVIALDALVPVVSPANPVRSISIGTLAEVLAGRVEDWSDLGGPEGPIRIHLPGPSGGLARLLQDRLLGPAGVVASGHAIYHAGAEDVADAVARDPLGIGMTTFSETGNTELLLLRGACGIATAASPTALKAEDYPLTTPLFLYRPPHRLPRLVREFLAYVRSPAAAPVIGRAGFVDLGVERIPLERQGERMANAITAAGAEVELSDLKTLVETIRGTERLSLSFRFEAGTATLDAQSRSNVDLLADQLEAGAYDGEPLLFAGFTDGAGSAAANLNLARERAEAVRAAVLDAAPFADREKTSLRVVAFGEAMPMACDDRDWGRRANRRVEVWVDQR